MSNKSFSFPDLDAKAEDVYFIELPPMLKSTWPDDPRYDFRFKGFIPMQAEAKYPAAMLAELLTTGEITKEQYERLRRKNK